MRSRKLQIANSVSIRFMRCVISVAHTCAVVAVAIGLAVHDVGAAAHGSTSSSPTAGSSTAPARPGSAATSASSAIGSPRSARSATRPPAHDGRRDQPRRRARVHRPARPVGVQRARGRPRRQQDHAGRDDRGHRRRVVDRAGQRSPDCRRRAPNAKHFGVAQDWRTLADYFKRLEERSHPAINVATFVGAGGIRNYVIGKDDRPATRGRAGADEAAGRPGDAAGRARPQHVAAVRAGPLRLDRRDRRAGEGGGALRRRLLHASALRERADLRIARRSVRDRRAREHSRRRSGT